jgi:hypothetical protein
MRERAVLIDILRPGTTSPSACFFGVWDGFGDDRPDDVGRAPRLEIPNREFVVFRGPIEGALAFSTWQSANLWWPTDRAWTVSTEIDLASTYVGGARACIESILRHPALEAFEVSSTDPVHYGADTLNT